MNSGGMDINYSNVSVKMGPDGILIKNGNNMIRLGGN